MGANESPFMPLTGADAGDAALQPRPSAVPLPLGAASVALLHGFDLRDQPLLSGLAGLPGELVRARSTVPLTQAMVGADVLVLFKDGNPGSPIVVGVLQEGDVTREETTLSAAAFDVRADGERLTLSAEREIVLRCGAASITLTRAGKVVIQGSYVLSRSSGYNKIKGAAIDIN